MSRSFISRVIMSGNHPARSPIGDMKPSLRNPVAMLICLLIAGCERSSGPTSGNTPDEMFRNVIMEPIPPSVANLQGVGDTWQGYTLFLRFTASEDDIDTIIATGYVRVNPEITWRQFILPENYDRFVPPWDSDTITAKEAYEKNNVQNRWTHSGHHYLAIDRTTGTVYFHGIGA